MGLTATSEGDHLQIQYADLLKVFEGSAIKGYKTITNIIIKDVISTVLIIVLLIFLFCSHSLLDSKLV